MIYGEINVEGQDPNNTKQSKVQTLKADPTLTVYFYNQTGKSFDSNGKEVSNLNSVYDKWVPEHMLSLNTNGTETKLNANGFINVSPRVDSNGYIDGIRWSEAVGDDTYGQNDALNEDKTANPNYVYANSAWSFQGTYTDEADTYYYGKDANNNNIYKPTPVGIWHFETRIKLEYVMSSKAKAANGNKKPGDEGFNVGDLKFSISVSDRPWVEPHKFTDKDKNDKTITGYKYYTDLAKGEYVIAKNYYRNSAWTGTDCRVKNYPYYDAINAIDVSNTKPTGNFISGIIIDSNFDKQNNAELIAADSRVNGVDREVVKVGTSNSSDNALKTHGTYNAGGYDNPTQANGLLPHTNEDNKFLYNKYTGIQYTYNVTADHEYLYFAFASKNLAKGDTFRIWINTDDLAAGTDFDHAIAFLYGTDGKVAIDSWYHEGAKQTKTNLSHNIAYVSKGNYLYAECRILLSDLDIEPTLAPDGNTDVLFYYYFSAEDFGKRGNNDGNTNNGLVCPRPAEGNKTINGVANHGFPYTRTNENAGKVYYNTTGTNSTETEQYDNVMLDYIKIDGKLDEEIWNEEKESERIVVNGDNGKWTVSPVKNESFEYSHVLFTGDNFIYGAVELDDKAILKSSSQTKTYTRIQLWLANPGAKDGWGEYEDGAKYDNYSYTIYLAENGYTGDNSVKIEGPSGQMCGASSPAVRSDDFKWAITTANGKTYVEFMIATESYSAEDASKSLFYMNQEAEYFISVKHGANEFYDGVTDKNAELTLNYPASDDKFYVTHLEVPSAEGAGVIYTDFSASGKYFSANGKWWMHVMFKAHPESGGWEIVGIRDGSTSDLNSDKTYGFSANEIQNAGADFIYCVNVGNNYISVVNEVKTKYNNWLNGDGKNATEAEKRAKIEDIVVNDMKSSIDTYVGHEKKAALHVNFSSIPAYYMSQTIEKTWEVGRIVCIEELNSKLKGTLTAQVQAMLETQEQAQVAISITRYFKTAATPYEGAATEEKVSFFDPNQMITHSLGIEVVDKPLYHEAGYKFIFTYKMYDPNPKYENNFPDTDSWYKDNAGKLKKQKKTTPETILVDGILNDSGWTADGWITVDEKINATVQINNAESFSYKYQIRNDGKYLYVAAVLEGVNYDSVNLPQFTLWTKDGNVDHYTKYFRVGYGNGYGYSTGAEIPKILDMNAENRYQSDAIKNAITSGASEEILNNLFENLQVEDNELYKYNEKYVVLFDNLVEAREYDKDSALEYSESAIYGYTETIEEYIQGMYYPTIRMEVQKYEFGKQSAVMKSGNGYGLEETTSTVVEFRVGLDEIDLDKDGSFEYFVSARRANTHGGEYWLFYPTVYCEPESEFSYYNDHFPFKEWYSETAIKVTSEDLKGDMYLANDYAPVVTLGAKFNDNFEGSNAIRFGAVYNEDLIRRRSGAENLDYWHVYDMGMLIAPTQKLGADVDAFNSDAEYVERISSIGIEKHIPDTNFADYESFVFYVTVTNIPDTYKKVKFSARPYIDYYNDFSNVEIYYGSAIERSLEMISNNQNQD